MKNRTCRQADRDFKNMVCGYPLPCPYHTVVIDTTGDGVKIEVPPNKTIDKRERRRLEKIGKAVKK